MRLELSTSSSSAPATPACEAAWAAARMGRDVALCTLSPDTIALMPCNPAIGGTAKGHLVREIDALGGLMGIAIDATGDPVQAAEPQPRARGLVAARAGRQARLRRVGARGARARAEHHLDHRQRRPDSRRRTATSPASRSRTATRIGCDALVVTTGTFLNGLVHVGDEQRPAGRAGEPPSRDLAESLKSFGFAWAGSRPARRRGSHRRSIDFSRFPEERGDDPPVPFSFLTGAIDRPQIACHLVHTTERVHALVREHIAESPLFNGQISGIGPRYCPSLEDKVMRFPARERHQIFLEPEGPRRGRDLRQRLLDEPARDVQATIVHALPGLEDAEILRPGYAVEYDFIQPTELDRTLADAAGPGPVPRRPDQRHVRLRGGRRAGADGRDQRGARGARR